MHDTNSLVLPLLEKPRVLPVDFYCLILDFRI